MAMGLVRDLLDALLPVPCAGCGELAGDGHMTRLCLACQEQLPAHIWPLASTIPGVSSGWYLMPYEGLGGQLVRVGKYGRQEALLAELSRHLASCARTLPALDGVAAVPSPWKRRVGRGFSFPAILARDLSEQLGVANLQPLRRRSAPRQARLSRAERWANPAATVRLRRPLRGNPTLLIVDDVVTTGATAAACAETLLLGGARRVHLLSFASALH